MQIIFSFLLNPFRKIVRYLYWLWRIIEIKSGKNLKINFPVIVEGKGKIRLGEGATLGKRAIIGIGRGTNLNTGDKFRFDSRAVVKIGQGGGLNMGNNVLVESGTRLYINAAWRFGNDVKIATNCQIFSREEDCFGKLQIGNGTHIGDNTIIDVADDVKIGNEVAIGPNCVIYSHDHIYDKIDTPAWKGGIKTGAVIIEDGVWIASGVTIMPGIRIGRHSVVAAGSVVTKDVDGYCVYGGVPAKKIKEINKSSI